MGEERRVLEEAKRGYLRSPIRGVFLESSRLEGQYGRIHRTGLEETVAVARQMRYRRVGLAFCIGLRREAAVIARVLEANGLEVAGACCKMAGLPKEEMGLSEHEKVHPFRFEACCNPVCQAEFLNQEGSGLNIVVGLCVGHDALFIKHCKALVTYLIVKDRVLGHNPAAAVCMCGSYYRERLLGERAWGVGEDFFLTKRGH